MNRCGIMNSLTLSDSFDLFSPSMSFFLVVTNCCISWERLGSWCLDFNQSLLLFPDSAIKGTHSSAPVLMLPFISVLCLLDWKKRNLYFSLSWHFSLCYCLYAYTVRPALRPTGQCSLASLICKLVHISTCIFLLFWEDHRIYRYIFMIYNRNFYALFLEVF